MTTEDIRWIQRFNNFKKALRQLTKFIEKGELNELEKQGLIQAFEYTYELAWNTIKDYMEEQGFTEVNSPRTAIKKAFETGLIVNGHDWMNLLLDRNLTTHTYDEAKATEVERLIHHKYFPLLKELFESLSIIKNEK